MSALDPYFASGERILYRTRLHPVVFVGAAVGAATTLAIVALIVHRNPLPPATISRLWLAGTAVAVASFVSPFVRWRRAEFAVTGDRVLLRSGFVRVRVVEVPLADVNAIDVEQTYAGRYLGYGTLGVADVSGGAEIIARVANAGAFREAALRVAPPSVRRRVGG